MNKPMNKLALLLASLLWAMPSVSEDIDLFMGPTPPADTSTPNVLFVIDNTGNWTAPFEDERTALAEVFAAIKARIEDPDDELKAINIGLMMFTETGGDDNNISGGYVRAAVRPMGEDVPAGLSSDPADEIYADLYSKLIAGFHELDDKANAGAAGLAMAEAYYYFSGKRPYAGNEKAKTDYKNNVYENSNATCCVESHPVWALADNALGSKGGTRYNSPIAPGSCAKNYIIWISNGPTQDPKAGGSDPIPKQLLAAAIADLGTGDITQIGLSPSGSQETWADEWARFMYQSPEAVTTFTVDVLPKKTGQGPGWSRLLKSMAEESKGQAYTVEDPTAVAAGLAEALNDAIDRILAVNSVFASVALPAASNAQSTFLNQVFIGQFRPDQDAHPRWPGNLKQYKLGLVDNKLKVLDADNDPIVDSGSGFIEKCSNSFWSSVDTYWSGKLLLDLDAAQICKENGSDSSQSNAPDGPLVEKGAQAQQLRAASPGSRKVYTCDPDIATCSSTPILPSFAIGNAAITDSLLKVDAAERDDTINWARGADLDDEDGNGVATDMRSTAHGDVVHSRPVALNYNTDAAPTVVVFYSGNDGMLRAINGNRPDIAGRVDPTGIDPGEEIWAFMPPEFYASIDILRENDGIINFPSSSADAPAGGISKPYGIDGPLTAFQGDVPGVGTDKKYLYAGLRRAGRAIYAFDVTSLSSPKMLWKKGCPSLATDTGCASGWEDIGQTWSQPNVAYGRGYTLSSEMKPMLIMGGGYDSCEDDDNNSTANNDCPADPKGNTIYILDAYDGTILKTFSTDRGVVGGVTVVPYGEKDPGIMFAYATDLGGNIYRISGGTVAAPAAIDTTHPSAWVMTKIASLGCATESAGCTANRKFLFGPDIVRVPNSPGRLSVIVGSGDREKPLVNYGAAAAVQNYFFTVFDQPATANWLADDVVDGKAVCGADIICLDTLTEVGLDGLPDGVTMSAKGWRFPLAAGEQVVTGAITVADVANFSTHIPAQPNDTCASNLGTAFAYNVGYKNAAGEKNEIVKGGLVPTPVAGMVILDNGKKVPMCIGCGGEDSAIGAKLVGSGITWTQPKSRVYWNIQQ